MDTENLAATARRFHALHALGRPLLLSNAWDVASALVAVDAGASAVATTSAGLAWSLGQPDGDAIDRDLALAAVARIAAAVAVPVTADVENGYAATPSDVAVTVERLLAAGVVGINIEDGDREPADLESRIAVARETADRAGIPLYINARTDVFLAGLGEPAGRTDESLRRAERYVAAGASGVFVPGVADLATVAALAAGIDAPLNVLAGPGSPSVAELAGCGVARISLGSSVAAAAYTLARRATADLLAGGSYSVLDGALSHGDLNGLLTAAVTP